MKMFLRGQCKIKRWAGCFAKKASERRKKDKFNERNWFKRNIDKLVMNLFRSMMT